MLASFRCCAANFRHDLFGCTADKLVNLGLVLFEKITQALRPAENVTTVLFFQRVGPHATNAAALYFVLSGLSRTAVKQTASLVGY